MIDLVSISGMGSDEKNVAILLFRQPLWIVERKQERGPQIPRWQKVLLAMLAMRLEKLATDGKAALELPLYRKLNVSLGRVQGKELRISTEY
jgi:hypothetical protein